MKSIWIILFVIISVVDISLSKIHDDSLETEINKKENDNFTLMTTEGDKKAIVSNKRKKFVVTLKPPINDHHKKYTRIKKKLIKRKEGTKHTKKPRHFSSKHSRVYKRKYNLKNKANDTNRKIFQEKIMKPDNISKEDESEETTAIVCKGIDIKNIKEQWYSMKFKTKKYKINEVSKLRKCLSKLKNIKTSLSKRKNERSKNVIRSKEIFNALQQLLDEIDKSDGNQIDVKKSSEENVKESKILHTAQEPISSNTKTEAGDEKIEKDSRAKRSVNIIEEERVPTTSTGYKYTGRDLSISHQFTYKNIHY